MQIINQTIKGIVLALKANYLIVEVDLGLISSNDYSNQSNSNLVKLLCTKRSRLSFIGSFVCVGDIVTVESIDWKGLRGVISNVEPRKSFINRPPVANFSHVLVVISLKDPLLDNDQISSFLLSAEETGQKIIIILTKMDLVSQNILEEYSLRLKNWGYESIAISIVNGQGIDNLYQKLKDMKLGVLCGPSGVGKSSLINYLLPSKAIPTAHLSKKLKRGRHTTRHVEIFSLVNGSLIADTPGFNNPQICMEPQHFCQLFPELRTQLETSCCKFRNCLHLDEPGCGVSKNWERYEYYKNYLQEILNLHRQD